MTKPCYNPDIEPAWPASAAGGVEERIRCGPPGWHVDGEHHSRYGTIIGYYIAQSDGTRIGETFVNCGFDEKAALANAETIARAPYLIGLANQRAERMEGLLRTVEREWPEVKGENSGLLWQIRDALGMTQGNLRGDGNG